MKEDIGKWITVSVWIRCVQACAVATHVPAFLLCSFLVWSLVNKTGSEDHVEITPRVFHTSYSIQSKSYALPNRLREVAAGSEVKAF